jgi:hypothetical protein
MTLKELDEVLGIVTKLLSREQPFSFIVDSSESNGVPLKAGLMIISWMKKSKPMIIKTLSASSIVFKNQKIATLLSWVFQRQKPAKPNLITTDFEKALLFASGELQKVLVE